MDSVVKPFVQLFRYKVYAFWLGKIDVDSLVRLPFLNHICQDILSAV